MSSYRRPDIVIEAVVVTEEDVVATKASVMLDNFAS
jgi:hypothetical protein